MCFHSEECPPRKAESAETPPMATAEDKGEATPYAIIWRGDEELRLY